MSFLLRFAFWFGLVLTLLPFGMSDDGDRAANALSTEALRDLAALCQRDTTLCIDGLTAAPAIGGQVAETVSDILEQDLAQPDSQHTATVPLPTPRPAEPVE